MTRLLQSARYALVTLLLTLPMLLAASAHAQSTPAPGLLNRDQAAAIFPDKVFYRGQSANVQGRNSAGIRLADGKLVLLAIVDTSGYSTSVQETYQAYLITEVTIRIGDQTLKPGAYGFGFIAGDRVVVMDLGANELLHTATTKDASLARPTPLQLIADKTPDHYRLYLGRSYVTLAPNAK
jgi:hypothetical protein